MIKPKWKSLLQRAVVEWLNAHPDVTKNELARRAGLDKTAIIRIASGEKDNLNGDSAIALAGVIGVSVEQLYQGKWQAAPAPAGAVDATTDVRGAIKMLSLDQLETNPLNPRKAFDDETIGELADSIATHGILQNLVSAPPGKNGRHIVTAGGRRQRALMRLAEAGRWDPAAPNIPVHVLAGDEPAVRALALVENLQRVELTPMEEAEAFAELQNLDPKTWTTARIAETVHRTQRFVQQRLSMATKLTAKAKRALADGVITVEVARELTKAPMKRQAQLVTDIETHKANGWHVDLNPESIRNKVTRGWHRIDHALFDHAQYKGEIVRDDETGEGWFTDAVQFQKLQRAAVSAKEDALKKERAWVKVVDYHKHQYFSSFQYNTSRAKDLSKTGAVIEIEDDWSVKVHDGLLEKVDEDKRAAAKRGATKNGKAASDEKSEPEPYTKSLLTHTKGAKTGYLQDAIVRVGCRDEGDTAICLAIIGMLGISAKVKIGDASYGSEDTRRGASQAARLEKIYADVKAATKKAKPGTAPQEEAESDTFEHDGDTNDDADGVNRPWSSWSHPPPAAIWQWLRSKTRDQRLQIFATLIADRCGYYVGYGGDVPAYHDAFDVALAEHLGLDLRTLWRPTETWIAGSRKARLEVMARGLGIDPLPKSTGQLRAAITERIADADKPGGAPLPPADAWVPPEMRVLDQAAFKKAFVHFKQVVPDAWTEPSERRSPGRNHAESTEATA